MISKGQCLCPNCTEDHMVRLPYIAKYDHTNEVVRLLLPPVWPKEKGKFFFFVFTVFFLSMFAAFIYAIILERAALVLVLVLLSLICLYLALDEYKRVQRSELDLPLKIHIYNLAYSKWQTLMFCREHNWIVDPDTGEFCEPKNLHKFLYKLI